MTTNFDLDTAYAGEPYVRLARTADAVTTLDIAYAGEPFAFYVASDAVAPPGTGVGIGLGVSLGPSGLDFPYGRG